MAYTSQILNGIKPKFGLFDKAFVKPADLSFEVLVYSCKTPLVYFEYTAPPPPLRGVYTDSEDLALMPEVNLFKYRNLKAASRLGPIVFRLSHGYDKNSNTLYYSPRTVPNSPLQSFHTVREITPNFEFKDFRPVTLSWGQEIYVEHYLPN